MKLLGQLPSGKMYRNEKKQLGAGIIKAEGSHVITKPTSASQAKHNERTNEILRNSNSLFRCRNSGQRLLETVQNTVLCFQEEGSTVICRFVCCHCQVPISSDTVDLYKPPDVKAVLRVVPYSLKVTEFTVQPVPFTTKLMRHLEKEILFISVGLARCGYVDIEIQIPLTERRKLLKTTLFVGLSLVLSKLIKF